MDRIDIHMQVPKVDIDKLTDDMLGEPSATVRSRSSFRVSGNGIVSQTVLSYMIMLIWGPLKSGSIAPWMTLAII